jgi:hypothetical protein
LFQNEALKIGRSHESSERDLVEKLKEEVRAAASCCIRSGNTLEKFRLVL